MTGKTLIFANGEIHDGTMVRQAIAAAAESYVMGADGGARMAQFYDVPLDLVIGDMDSLDESEVDALAAAGIEIERYPRHKNETDLELALMKAAALDLHWIRVIGALGGRIDQLLSNIYLLALPVLHGRDVRLVAGEQEAYLLHPGEHTIDGSVGDTLSLIPLGGDADGIRTHNLYYPLNNERLLFGPARGVSNVFDAPTATVELRAGVLLVVHTLGRA